MTAFDPAKLGAIEQDVTYCKMDGHELKMDVYYPASSGPWPGLVFVHGGGWTEGDKAPLPVIPTAAGYLVVSINYRMYPDYRFPAMIEDVKCAIRSLRAHAVEYNLDPERIALIGHSAGGHLAALAGLVDERAGWDVGPYRDQSSRVQAVIEMSGPTDLTRQFPAEWVNELKTNVFGVEQWGSGSPVTYAAPGAPPFLIVHGDTDDVVPAEQAHLLHNALLKAGAQSELIILQNVGHGFEPVGGTVTTSVEEVFEMILVFLARCFGGQAE
ncbi:MAG: alpha/beta hydrolase [Anaerolineae bacterium]|nr:alpha/beta hydrolase [Anaerolineae bacterium]